MKRVIAVLLCVLMLCGCGAENHESTKSTEAIIGGSEMPIGMTDFTTENEKFPIRMIKVDGELYYDTGKFSPLTPRCGTMDGELKNNAGEYEVPKNDDESNFEAAGYQHATGLTKELPTDEGWAIFRKISDSEKDLSGYTYCYRVKGQLNNAVKKSEYIVLAKEKDLTFEDVAKSRFSSNSADHKDIYAVPVLDEDKWGVTLIAEDVTENSLTVKCIQFGGNPMGELQTGAWYGLEKFDGEKWQKVEYKEQEYPVVWNSLAYKINNNDETSWEVNWEWLYGSLPEGHYRIAKNIMNFRGAGDFDEDIYYAEFFI